MKNRKDKPEKAQASNLATSASAASTATRATRRTPRLGRGLEALLGEQKIGLDARARANAVAGGESAALRQLPIEHLQRGKYQPRVGVRQDALQELAETVRTQGIIQPLLVRQLGPNQFEILAGERRWRAAQIAGLSTVPVVVKQVNEKDAMVVALIENIQREDLNAMEQAVSLRRLLDEFGLTHQQAADAIGRSRASVTNLLRLLTLHPAVKKLLEDGEIEMGHARTLLALPAQAQANASKQVVSVGMSVRQTELLVKQVLAKVATDNEKYKDKNASDPASSASAKDPDILHLENKLSAKLGARVVIAHRASQGRLVIYYHSLEELDGILTHIK